MIIIWKGIRY